MNLHITAYDVEQVDIALSQNMSILIVSLIVLLNMFSESLKDFSSPRLTLFRSQICCSWAVAGQVVMISIVPYMALVNGE